MSGLQRCFQTVLTGTAPPSPPPPPHHHRPVSTPGSLSSALVPGPQPHNRGASPPAVVHRGKNQTPTRSLQYQAASANLSSSSSNSATAVIHVAFIFLNLFFMSSRNVLGSCQHLGSIIRISKQKKNIWERDRISGEPFWSRKIQIFMWNNNRLTIDRTFFQY